MGFLNALRARRKDGQVPSTATTQESGQSMTSKDGAEGAEKAIEAGAAPVATGGEKEAVESSHDVSAPADKETKADGEEAKTKEEEELEAEDDRNYITGVPLAILTFGLCVALFTVALDNTIIATAIPKITTVFDSLNDVGWYGSSYLLTQTAFQPSFGKIYVYFNVKWVWLTSLMIFEVGSILCGAATSSNMLIVGRAVAGTGAAALFSGGMTIVAFSVPLKKRPLYIACLSSMFGIASVIGPILGGALTDRVSWRWCFYINIPIGAVALLIVVFFFKNPVRDHTNLSIGARIKEIDLIGAFFLICGIVCLLLALQWGGSVYPWKNSKVWGCLLGAGLLLIIFVVIQFIQGDRATIPPRIFLKQRTVFSSSWLSCFLAMGIYIHIFYLPFYFQAVKGTTAEGSGIRTIPLLVTVTLASIISGALITTFGHYTPLTWVGCILYTIGAGLISTLKVNTGAGKWIGYQILAGFGVGTAIQVPFIAVQCVLNSKDMPVGNAIAIFFNSFGGAISISIGQNIFSNILTKELPRQAPGIDVLKVISAGATHIREVTPSQLLPGVLEAYSIALDRAFYVSIGVGGIALISSFFLEMKSVKGKNLMSGGAA